MNVLIFILHIGWFGKIYTNKLYIPMMTHQIVVQKLYFREV